MTPGGENLVKKENYTEYEHDLKQGHLLTNGHNPRDYKRKQQMRFQRLFILDYPQITLTTLNPYS